MGERRPCICDVSRKGIDFGFQRRRGSQQGCVGNSFLKQQVQKLALSVSERQQGLNESAALFLQPLSETLDFMRSDAAFSSAQERKEIHSHFLYVKSEILGRDASAIDFGGRGRGHQESQLQLSKSSHSD